MKKYLLFAIAVAILFIGSFSASAFEATDTNDNSFNNHPILRLIDKIRSRLIERLSLKIHLNDISNLGGGCGGGHGCNDTNMTEMTGILNYDGSNFKIESTIMWFGCYNYINTTTSPYDFDSDGTIETIINELLGMVGTSITVEGYLRCQNTKLKVITINGLPYGNCLMGNSQKL